MAAGYSRGLWGWSQGRRLDMATAAWMCRPHGKRKRAGPKQEAGPKASAARSAGTMEARQGRDAVTPRCRARCATRTTARPAISQVDGDVHTISVKSPQTMAVHGVGKMKLPMNIRELHDDDLLAQAKAWRQRALRGDKDARGFAHELECEVRRRFPSNDTPQALPPIHLLSIVPQPARRRWKPW